MTRASLPATVGDRPWTVRVYLARGRVCVQWRAKGQRCTKSWPDSPAHRGDALRWAKDYAAERRKIATAPVAPARVEAPLTLAALWGRYQAANAPDWRPKTAKGYAAHAGTLIDLFGGGRLVAELGLEDLDSFKAARRAKRIAHGEVRRELGFLRQLVNWAEGRDIITRNRLRAYRYRVPLDERGEAPAEYSRAEWTRILAALDAPQHWRPRAALALCGTFGRRINSILHLCWDDVDFEVGSVTWRPEWDKTGALSVVPMTTAARVALHQCLAHRHSSEAWVFWAVRARGSAYHYNSLWHHLQEAAKRAGVPHLRGRGFHGARRMAVGDIHDLRLAGAWIGQKSLKITASYDRTRAADVEAGRLAIEGAERPVPNSNGNVIRELVEPEGNTPSE